MPQFHWKTVGLNLVVLVGLQGLVSGQRMPADSASNADAGNVELALTLAGRHAERVRLSITGPNAYLRDYQRRGRGDGQRDIGGIAAGPGYSIT